MTSYLRIALEMFTRQPPELRHKSEWVIDDSTMALIVEEWLERSDHSRCPVEPALNGGTVLLGIPVRPAEPEQIGIAIRTARVDVAQGVRIAAAIRDAAVPMGYSADEALEIAARIAETSGD